MSKFFRINPQHFLKLFSVWLLVPAGISLSALNILSSSVASAMVTHINIYENVLFPASPSMLRSRKELQSLK